MTHKLSHSKLIFNEEPGLKAKSPVIIVTIVGQEEILPPVVLSEKSTFKLLFMVTSYSQGLLGIN